jgi:hypothetical protein
MPFIAKVIEDSVSSGGRRLTTIEMTYPLIVHNELLTHRMLSRSGDWYLDFSRNSASNRAIPSSRIIEAVKKDPYIPMTFQTSKSGMIAGDDLPYEDQHTARRIWLEGRDHAINCVTRLDGLKVHKQWRNRLLTPYQWITTVCTGIDDIWEHFFQLRDHPDAQPDIAYVAHLAQQAYRFSTPQLLRLDEVHLPYILPYERVEQDIETLMIFSVARVARSSYLRQGEVFTYDEEVALFRRLRHAEPVHASPFEQVCIVQDDPAVQWGNLLGWKSLRCVWGL